MRAGGIQLQAAESVLCWVSPGHCHSVFAEGGSMRTFFGRGISQHTTAHKHTRTNTHTHTHTHSHTGTGAVLVRTEVDVGEAGGEGTPSQTAAPLVQIILDDVNWSFAR